MHQLHDALHRPVDALVVHVHMGDRADVVDAGLAGTGVPAPDLDPVLSLQAPAQFLDRHPGLLGKGEVHDVGLNLPPRGRASPSLPSSSASRRALA